MPPLDPLDTIVAISSPPGPAERGVVRLSGPDAFAIADDAFRPERTPDGPPGRPERRPGRMIVDGLGPPLPVALVCWPAPRTYTGQPIVEIHTTGSPPILHQLVAHLLARGGRSAGPGEFTLRAFLAGRLDLTQAEAVLGVIDAATPAQLEAALDQLAGGIAGPMRGLRDRLLDILAHLEAGLDFTEEPDVDPIGRAALAGELDAGAEDVEGLARRMAGRDRAGGSPRVVLVGPPNAGKSRLFNALIGAEAAIVSPIAGTTRDYLMAPCDCDGLVVELIDTAGAEAPDDAIGRAAQGHREAQADRADLLLRCRSADAPALPADDADRSSLSVWTKADRFPPSDAESLATSARTGGGLADLKRAIARSLRDRPGADDLPAGTGPGCRDGLARAGTALRAASGAIRLGAGDEYVAVDLRLAIDEIGQVVGAVVADDILERIFRRFCIGK